MELASGETSERLERCIAGCQKMLDRVNQLTSEIDSADAEIRANGVEIERVHAAITERPMETSDVFANELMRLRSRKEVIEIRRGELLKLHAAKREQLAAAVKELRLAQSAWAEGVINSYTETYRAAVEDFRIASLRFIALAVATGKTWVWDSLSENRAYVPGPGGDQLDLRTIQRPEPGNPSRLVFVWAGDPEISRLFENYGGPLEKIREVEIAVKALAAKG